MPTFIHTHTVISQNKKAKEKNKYETQDKTTNYCGLTKYTIYLHRQFSQLPHHHLSAFYELVIFLAPRVCTLYALSLKRFSCDCDVITKSSCISIYSRKCKENSPLPLSSDSVKLFENVFNKALSKLLVNFCAAQRSSFPNANKAKRCKQTNCSFHMQLWLQHIRGFTLCTYTNNSAFLSYAVTERIS